MISSEASLLASQEIEVSVYKVPDMQCISLSIGAIASFGGDILDETPTIIRPDALWVQPSLRGHGIGERLVRAFVKESRKLGVEMIRGHLESEYALDIRGRVFGKEALRFFHDAPQGSRKKYPEQYAELPITFEQARQSLVLAREKEHDLDYRGIGFNIEVDISEFDSE